LGIFTKKKSDARTGNSVGQSSPDANYHPVRDFSLGGHRLPSLYRLPIVIDKRLMHRY
jgi:hypothetical protein